jgi:hypothetical protein
MSRHRADAGLAGLKDFQRDTVAYVMDRYFGENPIRRFLVADETGLGKSIVAGGVVTEMLERLRHDDTINRIDVIYICSNQDIAKQNLERLAGPHGEAFALPTRLTLLGREMQYFAKTAEVGKPLNLVSFTPGTSFDKGWRTGKAEERAMLYRLLADEHDWDGWQNRAALRILQCTTSSLDRFRLECERLDRSLGAGIDEVVRSEFATRARQKGLVERFGALIADIGRRTTLSSEESERARQLVGELRGVLAEAGVQALEPDLVILDEFQRFRNLLDPEQGGEAAELAGHLFDYPDARVLLLSATPYKPFTFAEEAASGEDHHADLIRVLRFLCPDESWSGKVDAALRAYRDAVVSGRSAGAAREELRGLLLRVMCRTERPAPGQHAMLSEHVTPADALDAREVRSFVTMRRLGAVLRAPVLLDYWKSAPYFLNFVEGYLVGEHLRKALRGPDGDEVLELLRSAQLLDAEAVRAFAEIDLGNSRLKRFAEETVGSDWWQLLWLPPSMPHYALAGPFVAAAEQGITKRLVFSSWNATPTAVAALLSYEAERRIRQERHDPPRSRLDYRMGEGRVASMSTLALFWPHPGLATACDPLTAARSAPDSLRSLAEVERECRDRLAAAAPVDFRSPGLTGDRQPWRAVLRWPGAYPGDGLPAEAAIDAMGEPVSVGGDDDAAAGLVRHVHEALAVLAAEADPVAAQPEEVLDDLVAIGMHGPGNVAWRALKRLVPDDSQVGPENLWQAAAVVASGLRTLFNRVESMLLLDQLALGGHYWQAVLRYCAAGGLQAVLDEYLHTLRSSASEKPLTAEEVWKLALKVRDALTMRPAPYSAFDPLEPDTRIRMTGRFALRYGGRGDEEAKAHRMTEVRHAFNSPFWPFVVATTSAGQEGIDFHTYCAAVVHWNIPANPVDFEQREGRVHRFGGHAVRRNVAAGHRADALRSPELDVWKAAYDAARQTSHLGDLMPYWVFPGPARIERHVLPYPLSRDQTRYDQMQKDLALYRLAFGQPRQEDMLALLKRHGLAERQIEQEAINLRPPSPA